MQAKLHILAAASAALLLGASLVPATALDVSLGGISASVGSGSSGGTTASVGVGGTTTSATIGGSTLASTSVSSGDTGLNANISDGSGPLLATSSGDGSTDADVNLGGLLGILGGITGDGGGGGGGGGGGLTPIQIAGAYGGLSAGDQMALRNQCRTVLRNPAVFEANIVELCRIIYRLQLQN